MARDRFLDKRSGSSGDLGGESVGEITKLSLSCDCTLDKDEHDLGSMEHSVSVSEFSGDTLRVIGSSLIQGDTERFELKLPSRCISDDFGLSPR